jgi:hypothetical protein
MQWDLQNGYSKNSFLVTGATPSHVQIYRTTVVQKTYHHTLAFLRISKVTDSLNPENHLLKLAPRVLATPSIGLLAESHFKESKLQSQQVTLSVTMPQSLYITYTFPNPIQIFN